MSYFRVFVAAYSFFSVRSVVSVLVVDSRHAMMSWMRRRQEENGRHRFHACYYARQDALRTLARRAFGVVRLRTTSCDAGENRRTDAWCADPDREAEARSNLPGAGRARLDGRRGTPLGLEQAEGQ